MNRESADNIVSGYIDQLKRSCKLCHVAARIARVQILSLAAGNWLQRLNSGRQTLQFVFNARLRHFRFALVKFSCLLIRGTARSILKAQHFIRQDRYGMQDFRTTNAPHSVPASPHRPWQPPPAKFAAETFKHEKAKLDQPICYSNAGTNTRASFDPSDWQAPLHR